MKITVANPSTTPITYAEAKAHLRLDNDDEVSYITTLIDVVVSYAEGETESLLTARAVTVVHYDPPTSDQKYVLPLGPVNSLTSVADDNGAITDYDLYYVGNKFFVKPNAGTELPLTIVYNGGYSAVPADLKHAMLIHLAHLYMNREANARNIGDQVQHSLTAIYNRYRRSEFVG